MISYKKKKEKTNIFNEDEQKIKMHQRYKNFDKIKKKKRIVSIYFHRINNKHTSKMLIDIKKFDKIKKKKKQKNIFQFTST